MKLRAVLIMFLLSAPGLARAWWDEGWSYRKPVTLDTSASGADTAAAVTDVAVLIRLHTGNFMFLDAREDGGDLRFVAADDKTLLKHHVEVWDSTNELALIWVRVPQVAAGAR